MRALVAAAFLLGTAASPAQARDSGENQLATSLRKCAPETYEAALDCLDKILPARDRSALAAADGPVEAHFGLGLFIRNNWGLWKKGPLYRSMAGRGFLTPDDMSGAIIEGFAARERGESYRPAPPDPALVRAQWDEAVKAGRAGSVSCPKPAREAKTAKEFKAGIRACLDHMAKSLEDGQR